MQPDFMYRNNFAECMQLVNDLRHGGPLFQYGLPMLSYHAAESSAKASIVMVFPSTMR